MRDAGSGNGRGAVDPRLLELRRTLQERVPHRAAREPGMQEAAVAVILRPGRNGRGPELLLIHRAEHPADPWSGHIALPGGRRDPGDRDLVRTAYRETEEETRIDLDRVGRLWGPLDEVEPGSRRLPRILIAPFVVLVPRSTEAHPSPAEVQSAFWIPLEALRDRSRAEEIRIRIEGGSRAFPAIRFEGHAIWGLTLRILQRLLELAREAGL